MKIGQRVERTEFNIHECLTAICSETPKFQADKSLSWARGEVIGFVRGTDIFGDICDRWVRVQWDNGDTVEFLRSQLKAV